MSRTLIEPWLKRFPCVVVAVCALLLTAGCLQLDTRVRLLPDGSARISERIRCSKKLLDLGAASGPDLDVAVVLTRDAAQARSKHMGKGIRLESHEVKTYANGDKEAVIEWRIPDLNALRYASPFIRHPDYVRESTVAFVVDAVTKGSYLGDKPGELRVRILPVSALNEGIRSVDEQARKYPSSTPAQVQMLRRIQPVLRDLLKGLRLKFTFESYAPIHCSFALRGFELEGAIRHVDLLDVKDTDLDREGGRFFANEEILLDLVRWRLDTKRIRDQLRFANVNKSLPILMVRAGAIWFRPSRPLFDRYFKDVKLDYGTEGGLQEARFERIGFVDVETKAGKGTPDEKNGIGKP